MCRNETELCLAYGDYTCCKGLNCILGDPILPVGAGSCLPIREQPPSDDKCRRINHLCQIYGEYKCCEGLKCADTRTLPPVAGVNTQKLELPPGVGVCAVEL
uniref:Uncharacterized protein n=1 Tax=Chenopodium quinoa TaxID=63459 RepID=A0A803LYE4_CHEQI